MGSGSFPLQKNDDGYESLKRAADLIRDVHRSWMADVYGGDSGGGQADNAASDGGSLARIALAEQLIRGELKG